MKKIFLLTVVGFLFSCLPHCMAQTEKELTTLQQQFSTPPDTARPGVYWYFMDGNISKDGITKDLESMRRAGIGSVIFLEVNVGVPRGKVDFLSDEWKACFKHAVQECERLGICMTVGTGPGWTGSGGAWVKGEESMKHLVCSTVNVTGKGTRGIRVEKPGPKPPFFGEGMFTPEVREQWMNYYEDVAVLAFPQPEAEDRIKDIDEKALYYRAPYSSAPNVKPFLPRDTVKKANSAIPADRIIDLSDRLKGDSILWEVPEGKWVVMRFGARNNGAVTRPAPLPGVGFECDKADPKALTAHLNHFMEPLFETLGKRDTSLSGGLKMLHIDSWEMGAQNWTSLLRKEFIARRGYDPQPYYPIYAGYIIGSKSISERFLWDLRQTMQELMLQSHSLLVRQYAHKHGMRLSIEPYDMNPMQDLELGASADIPMCEFWSPGGFKTTFSSIEASSLANIKGQAVVPSEAFTKEGDGWKQHPASMKNQTDWAFAAGINRLMFHTFQHQPLRDDLRPGMTMGPYGVHWDRNQTWWPYVGAYHRYLSRCQYILQSGRTVADILYLAPEEAPFVFRAPQSSVCGDGLLFDRRGHNFDVCPPSLLQEAFVEKGKIKFPSGMEYHLLVLPVFDTVTPGLLRKIEQLVKDGASVIGLPPSATPGLTDYPACDKRLKKQARKLWGNSEIPSALTTRRYGKGKIYWGNVVRESEDNLYPNYLLTSEVLEKKMGIGEDFNSDTGQIRYIHKRIGNIDAYFVSNRTQETVHTTCTFRVSGKRPQLWNPINGDIRPLPVFTDDGTNSSLEMVFEPDQSFFVIFAREEGQLQGDLPKKNFPTLTEVQSIDGSWHVTFDPAWGGPGNVEFTELQDWSKHKEEGIRYYSGTAIYTKTFDVSLPSGKRYFLHLGAVKHMADITLNGHKLGTVWTTPYCVEITDALKNGENALSIEVTNLWINRLIGDEFRQNDGIVNGTWPEWIEQGKKRPGDRYTFTTFRHYSKDSPLSESGLLGRIRILKMEEI